MGTGLAPSPGTASGPGGVSSSSTSIGASRPDYESTHTHTKPLFIFLVRNPYHTPRYIKPDFTAAAD